MDASNFQRAAITAFFLLLGLHGVPVSARRLAAAEAEKLPAPSMEELAPEFALIEGILHQRRQSADFEPLLLSRSMLELGHETPPEEAAAKYALLTAATQLACEGRDIALMYEAVDAIDTAFEIDNERTRRYALLKFAQFARTAEENQRLVDETAPHVHRALNEGLLEEAERLVEALSSATARSGPEATQDVNRRISNLRLKVEAAHEAENVAATGDVPTNPNIDSAASSKSFVTPGADAAILPDGPLAASATHRLTLTSLGPARSVAFSPDGHLLAASAGQRVVFWNAATGSQAGMLSGHRGLVMKIVFTEGGGQVATASHDTTVRLWDSHAAKALATLQGHTKQVQVVDYSRTSAVLASGGFDGKVLIWSLAEQKPEKTLTHGETEVTALAFSPDGDLLVSGGRDGTLMFWKASTGDALAMKSAHDSAVNQIAFSPQGDFLVSAGADQTVKKWNAQAPFEAAVELSGHSGGASGVAVHPSGRVLATCDGTDGKIYLWDAETGAELASIAGHDIGIRAIAFSPDGTLLATCATNREVKLWDVKLSAADSP